MVGQPFSFGTVPGLVAVAGATAQPQGRRMKGELPAAITSDSNPITATKVDLRRMIFYDPRISKGGDVLPQPERLWVDGKPVTSSHKGQLGDRNPPTVYHAAGRLAQFWDGKARDGEEQAKGPVLNPVEMAMSSASEVTAKLRSIPGIGPEAPWNSASIRSHLSCVNPGLSTESRISQERANCQSR